MVCSPTSTSGPTTRSSGLSFAAAARTQLRIGTGICLLGLRDAVHTAKQVASLDTLSGGRFVFGVGFGWNEDEFANHGVSFAAGTRLCARRSPA